VVAACRGVAGARGVCGVASRNSGGVVACFPWGLGAEREGVEGYS
jgi:hypothetical protein